MFMNGSLAEWSKALVLGTSPKGRGFESHSCQIFSFYCRLIRVDKKSLKRWRCRGLNPGPFTCKANALPLRYIPCWWREGKFQRHYFTALQFGSTSNCETDYIELYGVNPLSNDRTLLVRYCGNVSDKYWKFGQNAVTR